MKLVYTSVDYPHIVHMFLILDHLTIKVLEDRLILENKIKLRSEEIKIDCLQICEDHLLRRTVILLEF